jgi:Arm DNA-binding domain
MSYSENSDQQTDAKRANPSGALWWRFKCQFEGREKLLSLGVHPHVSLQQARAMRDEAKKALANLVDPSVKRQAEKSSTANTFEAVAREWLALLPPRTAGRFGDAEREC